MPEPYKHHVVPQVQLRAFGLDGRVRVHPLPSPRSTRIRHVSETAYVENAYTIQTRSGPSASVEKKTFGRIENLFGPVINKLESGQSLDRGDWGIVGLMVATQASRDGHGRTFLNETVSDLMRAEESRILATESSISEENLRKQLDRFGRTKIVAPHIVPEPDNVSVAGLSVLIQFLLDGISKLQGSLLLSTGRDFVMSDSPVFAFEPLSFSSELMGEDAEPTVTTEITMPLTRRYAVLLTLEPIADEIRVGNDVVAIVNNRTLQSRFCTTAYAYPDPETTEIVARDFNSGWGRRPLIPILRALLPS